jgi:PAS domain S-box-containing protein
MSALGRTDRKLARGRLRITQLGRKAFEKSGDAAKGLSGQLDRYQSWVVAFASIIWTADPTGALEGEQPTWTAYTGQTPAELRGNGWLDAIHPRDRAETWERWQRALGERAPFEVEHRVRSHDGQYRCFLARAVPVTSEEGTVREWLGVLTEIGPRRLQEPSSRDGERQFRELADAMPQIVWGARPDGQFDFYNHRWYEFTGRLEGSDGDTSWADVVHPDDQSEYLKLWHAAIRSGDAYEIEYRLKRWDGEYRWHLTRALPVRDQTATITRWFGTCIDIDARRRTEDRLRASTAALVHNNRELEEFASVASHDLQEPLRKVQAFVGCLRDEQAATLNADGLNYLDRIQNAAKRMATLVSDLLEISRLSSKGRPFVPVDLNEVVADVLLDLEERLAQTSGKVEVAKLPVIASDPVQMRQLFQNLIGNALKFHHKHETPVVSVTAGIVDNREITGRGGEGSTCRISVTDNGIGFDEKYLDRVFTIFQRLHGRGEYEGTGIGLAICRKIVERHGGTITARSQLGQGATFVVSLPMLHREANGLEG